MEIFLFAIALMSVSTWLFSWAYVFYGLRQMRHVAVLGRPLPDDPPLPRVSIIVTSRNEELKAEEALRTLLTLDYPDFEIVYVNDRSDDRTGEIAERLQAEDGRIKTIHIRELPDGWFGKNHAAYRAAEAATGEVLLFTDGDVIFHPGVVTYAVRHLMRERLDHLCLLIRLAVSGPMLRACMVQFSIAVGMLFPLWKVRDPQSRVYFGVGPFNMFLARSYHAIGGHRRIALCPDEDVLMGKLVKQNGLRSDCVRGESLVTFDWYPTSRAFIRGVEKNFFATLNYSIAKSLVYTAIVLWLVFVPIVLTPTLAAVNSPWPAAVFGAVVVLLLVHAIFTASRILQPWWCGLLVPLAAMTVLYALWRSVAVASYRGIAWGGPPVPLSELRRHRI